MFFIFLSLSYPNLTIIRSLLPKCRLHPINLFIHLIVHSFQVYVHLFYFICTPLLRFNILLIIFQYSGSQKTSIPLPNLSNYFNYQYNNPSYHPNTPWFLIPNLPIPNFSTADIHPNPNFLFSWYPFQFPTYFIYSQLVLSHSFTLISKPSPIPISWTLVDSRLGSQ